MGSFKLLQHYKLITFIEQGTWDIKKTMKLLLVTALIGVAVAAQIKCYKSGDDAEAALTEATCDDEVTKCKSPVVLNPESGKALGYDCGACDPNTAASCKDCEGEKCNELITTVDFKCPVYKLTDKVWNKETTEKTCKKKEGDDGECNTPKDVKVEEFTATDGGCGKCGDAAKNCETVSSALGLSALLMPLVAAIYALC